MLFENDQPRKVTILFELMYIYKHTRCSAERTQVRHHRDFEWFFSCPGLPSARAPSIRCALASLRSRFVAPCDGAPAPGRIFPPRGSRSCGGGEPRSREAATAPAPPGPRSGRSDSARIGPAALRTLRGPAGGMDSSRYSSPLSPPSPSGRSRPSTQASTALAVPIAWAASAGSNSSRGGVSSSG